MLHVILQILSVIGIVFLILLAILILIVLTVLFVPIRYQLYGEKETKDFEGTAKVTFLFPILYFKLHMKNLKREWQVRILGIKIAGYPKTKRKCKNKSVTNNRETEDLKTEVKTQQADAKTEEPGVTAKQTGEETKEPGVTAKQTGEETKEPEVTAKQTEAETKKTEVKEQQTKQKYTFSSVYDKIKEVWNNISYYKERITAEENKLFFGRVKERLFKILKSIKPRVLKADLLIGTGSPDTTGYVCALYGMLSPILGRDFILTPDFEEKVLKGSFYAKGKIRIFTILRHGIMVLLDKQLKAFMKEMKRED